MEKSTFGSTFGIINIIYGPYVTNHSTLSFSDNAVLTYQSGLLMIVSILTVADWAITHRLKLQVSGYLLRTVIKIYCI